MLRAPDFGPVQIWAFGNYAIQITDPAKFIKGIVGTNGSFTTHKISEQLKTIAVTRFTDSLGESKLPVLDMAANYDELSRFCEEKMKPEFGEYGLNLTKFLVANISLPPEVEAALDKRTSMGIIGDMGKYVQYQTGESMVAAANNPSGGGAATGMGFGMANQMVNTMQQNLQGQPVPPPVPSLLAFHIVINSQQASP